MIYDLDLSTILVRQHLMGVAYTAEFVRAGNELARSQNLYAPCAFEQIRTKFISRERAGNSSY